MCKPLPWLIVLVCCCHSLMAQTDSLINLLKASKDDTNKVHLYWKTGASIIYQDPQASLAYFKKGTALAGRLHFISGLERCHNATSFAFSLNAKYDSALVYINYAVPYAKQAGDIKRLSLAYLNRADIYSNISNYGAALKDCDSAIYYAEKMNNADGLGRIYSIIAGVYFDQNKNEEAGINIDKSMRYFEKANNRRMIAQVYSDKAELYNRYENPAKALPLLKEAIRIGDSLEDIENLSAYYVGITETYARLKQHDNAKQAAKEAVRLSAQTGNILQEGNVYLILFNIEKEEKNMKVGAAYALKAYDIFSENADTFRLQIAASNLSECYFALNNHAQAYKYLKISSDLTDSLMQKKFNQETVKLQTAFEVKEKDKEIRLLNTEKELQQQRLQKQRFMLIGALAIALLTLSGGWLLFNRNKLRHSMKELELRNRIAADLHDEVGSSLSSIHMLSQMAKQHVTETAHQDLLTRMSSNAKETMDKMGDIVWMIKPGETEAGSLKQRIERFAYEVGSGKNMEVVVQLDELEKLKLTMEQRRNIYLICKEAVNNAAKYAGAGKITISAILQNRELQLVVKDEGKGFEQNGTANGNGLGNMATRAREAGGRLDIQSAPGKGASIILSIPL